MKEKQTLFSKKLFLIFGLTAIVAHLVGIAADLYSGVAPEVNTSLGSITSLSLENIGPLFANKLLEEARIGHYLAIFAIPIGLAGIVQVFLALNPFRNRLALLFLIPGALGVIYGTFYHGTLAFVIGAVQLETLQRELLDGGSFTPVTYFNSLSAPLGTVLLITDFLVSGVLCHNHTDPTNALSPLDCRSQSHLDSVSNESAHSGSTPPANKIVWLTVFKASFALWYSWTTITLLRGTALASEG